MEMSGQLHIPDALPTGKEPPVHTGQGGPKSRCGRCGKEKNLDLTRNKTPVVQPIFRPIPTDVSRLQHKYTEKWERMVRKN
jgi:hypothetical protein